MDNQNTVLFEDLIKFMNEKTKSTVTVKSCGQDIEVTPVISMSAFDNCVARIVDMLYDDDGNYVPNLKEFFIRIVLLFAYTNVRFPDDVGNVLSDLYELVYRTTFYNDVMKAASAEQVSEIRSAVDSIVEYHNQNNMDKVNKQISILSDGIENLGSQLVNVFGNLSDDDVKKLLSAIENNQIDEGKLMRAYANDVLTKVE